MSIGKEEKIFTDTIHIECRIMLHDFEIQCGQEICTTQRATWVSALHTMNHAHNISSDLRGCFLQ